MKTLILICLLLVPSLSYSATDAENRAAIERFARHVDDQENGRTGYSSPSSSSGGSMGVGAFLLVFFGSIFFTWMNDKK